MYIDGLAEFMLNMKEVGDQSGEWAYRAENGKTDFDRSKMYIFHPLAVQHVVDGIRAPTLMTDWQPLAAWSTFLIMLGRVDGDAALDDLSNIYLTEQDFYDAFLDYEFTIFYENEDWESENWNYTRPLGFNEVQGILYNYNDYENVMNKEAERYDCVGRSDQCVFPWVSGIIDRQVITPQWWGQNETLTYAAVAAFFAEWGKDADGGPPN